MKPMPFESWLRALSRQPARPRKVKPHARRFRPVFEQLESRLTPSSTGSSFNHLVEGSATVIGPVASFTDPNGQAFNSGNLLLSESVYTGSASTVTIGQPLPGGGQGGKPGSGNAVADGSYPGVWANESPDPSFGVTSPIYLVQLTSAGTPVGSPLNVTSALGGNVTTSFPSKSELALNLSADGSAVTFLAYMAPANTLDVSNSNTPGHIDVTNPVDTYPVNEQAYQRVVVQLNADGTLQITPVNAYSGNNGRSVALGSTGDYYMVGNAGNGGNFTVKGVSATTGSTTLTTGSTSSTTGLEVGQPISGTNIPAGATVASILSATQFTISAPTTGPVSGTVTITQDGNTLSMLSDDTGVQMIAPGDTTGNTTVVGQVQGTFGNPTGYQRGFSTTLVGLPADKTGKDDNFRGLTIFNDTLYVTKGSGSNGVDTVYQVGSASTLPTLTNAGSTVINVLPGFPTVSARTQGSGFTSNGVSFPDGFYPFGIWFANATTLYVADEGDGVASHAATDPMAGLEKWTLQSVNGTPTWVYDYTLQAGLNLGVQYSVANGPNGEVYPTNLNPATAGLRNLTGRINPDGTVTLYAVTSTVSAATDQGADPNQLVAITDDPNATTLPANEQFTTLQTAGYGVVLRGVTLAPTPTAAQLSATIDWGDGTPATTGTVTGSGGSYTVSGVHTYTGEEGLYPITTTLSYNGTTTTAAGQATVQENIGILVLDPTGKGALTASDNAMITITGGHGALVVNSSHSQAAIASDSAVVNAQEIDAAGTLTSGQGSFVGPIDNSEAALADPLGSLSAPPVPTTVQSTHLLNINSTVTLQPGLYIGGINIFGHAHVTLAPGLYYLQAGGFTVSDQATVTDNGQGVMLYKAADRNLDGFWIRGQAKVSLTGLTAAELTALGLTGPQYAGYLGLAIFQDRNSTAAFKVTGQGGSLTITGTVYAAAASVLVGDSGSINLAGDATKQFGSHLLVADLTVRGHGSVSVDTSENYLEPF
jgi:hypothetical protein